MAFDWEDLKRRYDLVIRFVEWFAEDVVHKKNWIALLILFAVVVFVAFNPLQWPFKNLLAFFPRLQASTWYLPGFCLILGAIAMLAILNAVRTRKRLIVKHEPKLSAIKRLLPYGHNKDDIEIFAALQRKQNLDECLGQSSTRSGGSACFLCEPAPA